MITVVDYKLNNLRSIENTLRRLGHDVQVTSDPDDVAQGDEAHPSRRRRVSRRDGETSRQLGLVEPFVEQVKAGRPTLGICLGMHLLFTESEEFGLHRGLDLIPGRVRRIPERLRRAAHGMESTCTCKKDEPLDSRASSHGASSISFTRTMPNRDRRTLRWPRRITESTSPRSFTEKYLGDTVSSGKEPERRRAASRQLRDGYEDLSGNRYSRTDKPFAFVRDARRTSTVYGDPLEMAQRWVESGR